MSIGISRNIIIAVAGAMLLMPGSLFAQDPLPLTDLAQLKMKVTSAGVVADLYAGPSDQAERHVIKAGDGLKIVVVTLKGAAPRPCTVTINTSDFSCVYDKEVADQDGKKERSSVVGPAVAAAFGEPWSLSPGIKTTTLYFYKKGEPVVLKFAFAVPVNVNGFLVRHPTFSAGKAVIPGKKR